MSEQSKGRKKAGAGGSVLPKLFRKPVSAERWQKKYIKRIYLPEDRAFLSSLAVEEDGFIRLSSEKLNGRDLKRLKKLAKAIKANRKKVDFLVILIIAVIAVAAVTWEFRLKNRVARQVVEQQLEKVFLADVEAGNVDLRILRGAFSIGPLIIADTDSPMTNLVKFEKVNASLDVRELLSGRIRIVEIGFSGMKAGTSRGVSGQLQDDAAEGDEDNADDPVGDVISRIGLLAGELDAEQLFEQQKENLESFSVIDESIARVNEVSAEWEITASDWETRLSGWDQDIRYVSNLNPDSFNSIEKAASAVEKLQRIYNRAETDYAEVQKDIARAGSGLEEASVMKARIDRAVESDYAYIESLVVMSGDQQVDWAASVLEQQLSMPITRYLGWLEKGLVWYERFSLLAEKRSRLAVNRKRIGRSLPEPVTAPPGLVIEHAYASGEADGVSYEFNLYDLVDEPEKWERETRLNAVWTDEAAGHYEAEIRPTGLRFQLTGLPYSMGDILSDLGIADIYGQLSAGSVIEWDDDVFSGRIDLDLPDIALKALDEDNLAFRLINSSLEAARPVTAAGGFVMSGSSGLVVSLDASVDTMLAKAADSLLAEGAGEGIKLLKQYLSDELAGPLEKFGVAGGDLEGLIDEIAETGGELDSLMTLADRKIAEAEKYAADAAAAQLENILPPGSTETIDKAAEDIKKGLGGLLNF